MNPRATMIETSFGEVPIEKIVDTNIFDINVAVAIHPFRVTELEKRGQNLTNMELVLTYIEL